MLADPLTKNMKLERLLIFLESGTLDLEPTPASLMFQMMKQKQRKEAKKAKEFHKDHD